jgi:hypothetical protein
MILTADYQNMVLELNRYYDILSADPDKKEMVVQRTLTLRNMYNCVKNFENEMAVNIISTYAKSYVRINMIKKVNRTEILHIAWD